MIVRVPKWLLFFAVGLTVFPFIFLRAGIRLPYERWILKHERVHLEQQRRWAIYGVGVGLLVWFALYLFALPVGWNPFRERWEREAYRAEGVPESEITHILRTAPYFLWWAR